MVLIMRKAVINKNNIVENIIEADDNFSIDGFLILDAQDAAIGSEYIDGEFVSPVDDIRADKIGELKEKASVMESDGLSYQGKVFQIDADARANMMAVQIQLQLGNTSPHGGFWRSLSNESIAMDDAQVAAFFQAAFSYVHNIKKSSWNHAENIATITDKEILKDYNLGIGW